MFFTRGKNMDNRALISTSFAKSASTSEGSAEEIIMESSLL